MTRRVFFDTNILLDVLTEREPFYPVAALLWSMAEKRLIEGLISAISIPTAYYLLRRVTDRKSAVAGVEAIRGTFEIIAVDQRLIDQALALNFADFEDGLQACAAMRGGVQCIVTRDPRGFRKSDIPAHLPQALIDSFNGDQ